MVGRLRNSNATERSSQGEALARQNRPEGPSAGRDRHEGALPQMAASFAPMAVLDAVDFRSAAVAAVLTAGVAIGRKLSDHGKELLTMSIVPIGSVGLVGRAAAALWQEPSWVQGGTFVLAGITACAFYAMTSVVRDVFAFSERPVFPDRLHDPAMFACLDDLKQFHPWSDPIGSISNGDFPRIA